MRHRALLLLAAAALLLFPSQMARAKVDWNRMVIEVGDLSSLSLSPAGDRLLLRVDRADLGRNGYQLEWLAIDTRSGKRRDLGSAGEALFDDPGVLREKPPAWLANGDAVVRQFDGRAVGIWRLGRGDNQFRPLVVDAADVLDMKVEPGAENLVYELGATRDAIVAAEDEERTSGVLVDQHVDLAQDLYRGGRVNGRMASQRLSGYWFMRRGLLADAPRIQRRWSPSGTTAGLAGEATPPRPFVPPAHDQVASLDDQGQGRVVARWGGASGRIEWQAPGGQAVACRANACTTLRTSWLAWRTPGRELMVGLSDRFLRTTVALWTPANNRLRILSSFDGMLGGSRRFAKPCEVGRAAAYCVAAGPASPPRLVSIDLATGRMRTLLDPNARLRAAYRPVVERMMLKLGNGLPVAATILTAKVQEPRPRPFFVNYYRCDGFLRGGEGDEWPLAALLEAGFGVACLNAAPLQGPHKAVRTYQNGAEAVSLLVDRLAGSGVLDRKRVAMGGFSFGSEVAIWTAMKTRLLAVVSIASAQVEPADYWFGSILGASHDKVMADVWGLGDPDRSADAWRATAPAKNAALITAPVLLQLPEQEARRIPELFVRLRNAGTPVEFWAYPDEGHLKIEPRHRLAVYQRNYDWFRYWLQGWRDPTVGKVAQYQRWDAMMVARSGGTRPPRP